MAASQQHSIDPQWRKALKEIEDNDCWTTDDLEKVDRKFFSEDSLAAYRFGKWALEQQFGEQRLEREKQDYGQEHLWQRISRMDYSNAYQRGDIGDMLDAGRIPFCPLGEGFLEEDEGIMAEGGGKPNFDISRKLYRLMPSCCVMEPHKSCELNDLPNTILGVNLNVEAAPPVAPTRHSQGRARRQKNLPDASVQSGGPNDIEPASKGQRHGFVFMHIGMLEACKKTADDANNSRMREIMASEWAETGFAVVVEIDSSNRAGALFVIYNFFPIDHHDTLERYHVYDDWQWGFLDYDSETQFSVAKIADSIQQLGWRKTFTFDIWSDHEVELVPVIKSTRNTLVRKRVDRTTPVPKLARDCCVEHPLPRL